MCKATICNEWIQQFFSVSYNLQIHVRCLDAMIPKIKKYLIDRFEQVFVLVVVVSIALINY